MERIETIDAALKTAIEMAIENGYSDKDIKNVLIEALKENRDKYNSQFIAAGTHGTCSWNINKNGVLNIWPTDGVHGELENQSVLVYTSPWENYAKDIAKVVVKDGVAANYDASYLFSDLKFCKEMDMKGLDTSKAKDMDYMFSNCERLEWLDVKNFNTSNAKNMRSMFDNCMSLKVLNLDGFNTKEVTDMTKMFNNCISLQHLFLGQNFITQNATQAFMFESCNRLVINSPTLEELLIKPEKSEAKGWEPPKHKEQNLNKEKNIGVSR